MSTTTEAVAEFCHSTHIDDVSTEVRESSVRALDRVLSRAISGGHASAIEIINEALGGSRLPTQGYGVGPDATLQPFSCALSIGAAASLVLDEGASMFERLASVIVPTSFVAAQRVDCSGATLIRAIAIGGEIGLRTANALGEEHVSRGWDPVGSAGRIGAAAAVSVVFGLSSIQIQNALGFASTMSAGIQSGSEALRACIAGKASGDAIEAATLAKYGLIGPPLPLEGRRGLFALVAPSRDPGELVDKLGTRWEHTILFSPGDFADVVDQLVHAPDVTSVSERFAKLTGSSESA